mmetsp:Transcript_6068/g.12485  ORF Transcript_6068/g.12485 Transcript_6068/m.12485 type:complete len:286 (+) Transcript_6068:33-890(+)
MSQKKPFSTLRPRHDDDYGITELLRQVAERSSLNEEEKKEVSQIVKNVERKVEEKTPMGKIKYKMKDSVDNTIDTIKKDMDDIKKDMDTMGETIRQSVAKISLTDAVDAGDDDASQKSSQSNTSAEASNKWGKDLLHKFSMPKNPLHQNEKKAVPTPGASAARDYFKTFTLKGMQNPLKSPTKSETGAKIKARRQEIAKALERSSQSGRDLFQNFSKNFENSLQKLENSLAGPSPQQVEADYDVNSSEYKMDLKGIALLKEIFPDESTENLIKMHFEHIQVSKQQ